MRKINLWAAALFISASAQQAGAQSFTCAGSFIGSDTQDRVAHAIIEDGGRAVGVQRVFVTCRKGTVVILVDGNNETSTPSYKERWQKRAAALLPLPDEKVVVR
ncbi:hypothetical protein [Pseudomonas brassicacearum]|uniref:hypothetical protein n=1 Tax=Pseudomonas brassicacearum TaxID=930166 RepID=UPI001DEE0E61|nr:hypothetical protein [Pseudomonas brassicacearum]CAH0160230.1 hypothetical protein SRABI06_00943 [Pseudomonas brassicacearum]